MFTGAFVAVHDALGWMRAKGMIAILPVKDFVAAVSVGLYQGNAVLDLDYAEDSACQADMNVVMTGAGRIVEVHDHYSPELAMTQIGVEPSQIHAS